MVKTTTVQTADLWAAIDALDGIPDAQSTDWYERIVAAAEAATQAELVQSGIITKQKAQMKSNWVSPMQSPSIGFRRLFGLMPIWRDWWRDWWRDLLPKLLMYME